MWGLRGECILQKSLIYRVSGCGRVLFESAKLKKQVRFCGGIL